MSNYESKPDRMMNKCPPSNYHERAKLQDKIPSNSEIDTVLNILRRTASLLAESAERIIEKTQRITRPSGPKDENPKRALMSTSLGNDLLDQIEILENIHNLISDLADRIEL